MARPRGIKSEKKGKTYEKMYGYKPKNMGFQKGNMLWKHRKEDKGGHIKGTFRHTEKSKIKIGLASLGRKLTKEHKEKILRNMLKSIRLRPTSLEKKMMEIIEKYKLPYKYTGNGSFIIAGRNPDFINCNGEKIAIEVYAEYFKIREHGSVENYQKFRINLFRKYGWNIIFFNENEINDINVLKKLEGEKHGKDKM